MCWNFIVLIQDIYNLEYLDYFLEILGIIKIFGYDLWYNIKFNKVKIVKCKFMLNDNVFK